MIRADCCRTLKNSILKLSLTNHRLADEFSHLRGTNYPFLDFRLYNVDNNRRRICQTAIVTTEKRLPVTNESRQKST